MFKKKDNFGYKRMVEGVKSRTLVHGEKTSMHEFVLKEGHSLPTHAHPHEQTGYLISGHMKLVVDKEEFDVTPGDSWNIAGGVEHSVELYEESVAIEVFSPVRTEFLD